MLFKREKWTDHFLFKRLHTCACVKKIHSCPVLCKSVVGTELEGAEVLCTTVVFPSGKQTREGEINVDLIIL